LTTTFDVKEPMFNFILEKEDKRSPEGDAMTRIPEPGKY
jgi:hypothetical protein